MPVKAKPIELLADELNVDLAVIEAICADDTNFLAGYVIDVECKERGTVRAADEDAIEEIRDILSEAKQKKDGLQTLLAELLAKKKRPA